MNFVTIIAPVPTDQIEAMRAKIEALGNPANPQVTAALHTRDVIHFGSMNVFAASAGDRGHLVLEFSGDGEEDDLLTTMTDALGPELEPIFAHTRDRGTGALRDYLKSHSVKIEQTLLGNAGLPFTGTPGMSVERIRREQALAAHVGELVGTLPQATSALDRLNAVRRTISGDDRWRWALEPEPLPPRRTDAAAASDDPLSSSSVLFGLIGPLLQPSSGRSRSLAWLCF